MSVCVRCLKYLVLPVGPLMAVCKWLPYSFITAASIVVTVALWGTVCVGVCGCEGKYDCTVQVLFSISFTTQYITNNIAHHIYPVHVYNLKGRVPPSLRG